MQTIEEFEESKRCSDDEESEVRVKFHRQATPAFEDVREARPALLDKRMDQKGSQASVESDIVVAPLGVIKRRHTYNLNDMDNIPKEEPALQGKSK